MIGGENAAQNILNNDANNELNNDSKDINEILWYFIFFIIICIFFLLFRFFLFIEDNNGQKFNKNIQIIFFTKIYFFLEKMPKGRSKGFGHYMNKKFFHPGNPENLGKKYNVMVTLIT